MVNACADQDLFVREGGGGPSPTFEKTALIFLCVFWGFLVQKIPGMRPTIYEGGGVQMLISIEFDRTCDLPGVGSGPPPPPSLWICTCMTFKDLRIKSKGEESAAREEGNI